jgi:carboxyl-terminal processing protease
VVVGSQTFGKGSVQTIVELEDGSALKLTVARYFTPKHRSIQERGITPDVPVVDPSPGPEAEPGPGTTQPGRPPVSARPDPQLDRAVDLLKAPGTFRGLPPGIP